MKYNLKLKNLYLFTIMSITSIGLALIMLLNNVYFINYDELFESNDWNPTSINSELSPLEKNELSGIEIELNSQNNFYYAQLKPEEKKLFNYIYMKVSHREEEIYFNEAIPLDLLNKMVYILRFDFPEFYFIGNTYDYTIKNKKVEVYKPSYIITEEEYNSMQDEIATIVSELKIMVENKTQYESEIIIHNYLIQNCEYVLNTDNCNNMYGAIIEGKANCEGYSSAFSYLLRTVSGINSSQVIGVIKDGSSIGHSWNLVQIDNEYYYVDSCWDDLENTEEYSDIKYHYSFFNITYKELIDTRDVSKTFEYLGNIPETNALEFNYYKKSGFYAETLKDAKDIVSQKLESSIISNSALAIKCNNKETYDLVSANLTNIIKEVISQNNITLNKCKYAKIDNGYTIIIHKFK